MAKDVRLYGSLAEDRGSRRWWHGPAPRSMAIAIGYGEKISNRIVDAYGDLAGGVRVADAAQASQAQASQAQARRN